MVKKYRFNHELLADALFCSILGFGLILCFACYSSIIRPLDTGYDSTNYKIIGKLWAEGLVPYRDVFDHKGPLLFLIERLCWMQNIVTARTMLYILESLCASVSLFIMLKTLYLRWNRCFSYIIVLLIVLFWIPVLDSGNYCEEYSMPLICVSVYLQIRWLLNNQKTHKPLWALCYGLCFGANVLIRANNGILIAVLTLFIAIRVAAARQWKNLLANAGMLILGVAIAVTPMVLYFAANDALDEMIYGVWTHNIQYSARHSEDLTIYALRDCVYYITPALICFVAGLWNLFNKNYLICFMNITASLLTLLVTVIGECYSHYFMLCVPLIPLTLCSFPLSTFQTKRKQIQYQWVPSGMILAVLIFSVLRFDMQVLPDQWVTPMSEYEIKQFEEIKQAASTIVQAIPREEYNDIALIDLNTADVELLLLTDLHPSLRFCFLQSWMSETDPEIGNEIHEHIRETKSKWILTKEKDITCEQWQSDILSGYVQYMLIPCWDNNFILYQKSEV